MSSYLLRKIFVNFIFAVACFAPVFANAGGIVIGGTRLIYPSGARQANVSINNTSDKSSFLVQSWVEDAEGKKTTDFIVTPPLYVSGPLNENILRVMYTGEPLPQDKETLYYFNAKAIPSVDKKKMEGKNLLLLSAVTRIKLFVRPDGLKIPINDAPSGLEFYHSDNQLKIKNPTPYYITIVQLKTGETPLKDVMVPPGESITQSFPVSGKDSVTFRTINDYGALTPELKVSIK